VIVLDTHVWIWWLSSPERLSRPARDAIADSPAAGVCTLSVWELGTLVRRGRIELDRALPDWVKGAFNFGGITPIAPDARVALLAAGLSADDFPGDPADRFIYATAQALGTPLVTRDAAIRRFDPAGTVW
jgi:PIN domain nuclease of toxin-antitoxin system